MVTIRSVVKMMVFCGLLALPFVGNGYAEDASGSADKKMSGASNTFEEALTQNEGLQQRYEKASPEERQKIQTRWQKNRAKLDSMSDAEKAEMKQKMAERKAQWDSMSDAEKAEMQKKRAERKAKWDKMSDAEKAAMKEKMAQRKSSGSES